jgi:ABC-type nitrate/sulfonate/bicarbonate transport system ATPase subunit
MKNVAFGIRDGPKSHQERELMVREALKLVQLEQFVDYYPFQLSGGMQQRLALARALVNNPEILLLDEPFHSLDSDLKFFLHDELLKIQRLYHKTIILVSHDMDEVVYLSNRVLAL